MNPSRRYAGLALRGRSFVRAVITVGLVLGLSALAGCGVSSTDLSEQGALPALTLPAVTVNPTQPTNQYFCVVGNVEFQPFGCTESVTLGQTATAVLAVQNVGTVPLVISAISVLPGSSGTFAETSDCTTNPVPAQGICSITITFAPTTNGTATATLCLTSNSVYGSITNASCPAATSASYGTQSVTLVGVGQASAAAPAVAVNAGLALRPTQLAEVPLGVTVPVAVNPGAITLQAVEGGLARLRYPDAGGGLRQILIAATGPVAPPTVIGAVPVPAVVSGEALRDSFQGGGERLQVTPAERAPGIGSFAMRRFVAGPSGWMALDHPASRLTIPAATIDLAMTAVYDPRASVYYVVAQEADLAAAGRQSVTVYQWAARIPLATPTAIGRYRVAFSHHPALGIATGTAGSRSLAAALTCEGSLYVGGVFDEDDGQARFHLLQMPVTEPTC